MGEPIRLCSGAEAVRKFSKAGWAVSRSKGSHVMLVKQGYQWTLSVPQHKKLGPGLLKKLVRQAELDADEFNAL
ncbi:MAG TPA: type II toxin-antitoxin system HicA family toxin [Nitrospirae bacterium]|nr:type II toxin-antitoxin system HicA family toxin [Nitrospirota bacterium]